MNGSSESSKNLNNYLKIFAKGAIMGIAEVIPGVSGSTLALIMGFYHKFIDLLDEGVDFAKVLIMFLVKKKSKTQLAKAFTKIEFGFAIPLLAGSFIIILIFSNFIETALHDFPQYVFAIFFGLILTSISVPLREVKEFKNRELFIFIVSFLIVFLILGYRGLESQTNPSLLLLLFGGIVGISGMVLPGISGSFILLLLGLYEYVFSLIKDVVHFDINQTTIIQLAVFISGLVLGLATFVKFLKYLLKEYNTELMVFLSALMAASLRILWPFMDIAENSNTKVAPWRVPTTELFTVLALLVFSALISWKIINFKKK